jgi:hypothetical protein
MSEMSNPAGGRERTAMLTCAVVGALALLTVLGVGLFSSDKASGGALDLGGGPGGGQRVGPGAATTPGGVGSRTPPVDARYLRAHFPVPPGAVRTHPGNLADGEKQYKVRASLASVKAFYKSALPPLDAQWNDPSTTTNDTGRITGWHGGLYAPGDPPVSGFLSMDDNFDGDEPGVVTIQVTID